MRKHDKKYDAKCRENESLQLDEFEKDWKAAMTTGGYAKKTKKRWNK